ncbi:hypothetical protein, variant 3 [Aphanomyces invadans]|uniref:PRELI/MSF1 domain-containing protein n=1 Tax=Aphanomyces invadans TaxID=157072 RepID=A0A024TXF8_9STRA|nr:hypothetical protein, variant 3 [Aphanomyces invadans]ETV98708.1 hypothetical protein, variant 3 [Aphanomyces invadans]|eukprot:XP_008872905.1 hypothetical protein, variant 3 [Aphanomyces invadans]
MLCSSMASMSKRCMETSRQRDHVALSTTTAKRNGMRGMRAVACQMLLLKLNTCSSSMLSCQRCTLSVRIFVVMCREQDAPNSESASSGTSRQSMARRIKRYKPQKAGQTSFPRLVGTFFGTLALLLVATTVAISLSRTISDVCRPLAHASGACDIWLASHSIRVTVGWVSIGLAFGTLLQSNLLQWNILSVLYYVDAPRGTAQERSEASEGAADLDLLHSLGLVLGKVGAATEEHPVMVFKPVPGSAALGSTRSVLEHPIEITADMHFRRFKEPFPDPAQPAIAGIELVEEVPLPKWRCVYRKRRLKLQNNTPGFIKRFANAEFFDVAEESLWDQANHVLYVRGRNESFAHLVLVEDFLLFQRHDERDGWSQMTQTGACTIGGAFGFLRGTVEGFVRESYGKSVKKAQDHLVDRLDEEVAVRSASRALP